MILFRVFVAVAVELDDIGHIEHVALGVLLDGLVEGGLQAVLDHDQVGARESDGAAKVGSRSWGSTPGSVRLDDVDVGPPDPLGDQGQGVQPGCHPDAAVVGGGRCTAGQGSARARRRSPTPLA